MEDKLVNKIFKGLIRFLIEVIVMTVLIVGINIFTNGMYLWGLPRINDIQSVNIHVSECHGCSMTTLKNPLHDSNNGLDYTLVNDYYLPNLTTAAPAEQHPTERWGRLHKKYLQEHHPIRYNQLLLSGELGSYLATLDEQADKQLALIVRQMQDSAVG